MIFKGRIMFLKGRIMIFKGFMRKVVIFEARIMIFEARIMIFKGRIMTFRSNRTHKMRVALLATWFSAIKSTWNLQKPNRKPTNADHKPVEKRLKINRKSTENHQKIIRKAVKISFKFLFSPKLPMIRPSGMISLLNSSNWKIQQKESQTDLHWNQARKEGAASNLSMNQSQPW